MNVARRLSVLLRRNSTNTEDNDSKKNRNPPVQNGRSSNLAVQIATLTSNNNNNNNNKVRRKSWPYTKDEGEARFGIVFANNEVMKKEEKIIKQQQPQQEQKTTIVVENKKFLNWEEIKAKKTNDDANSITQIWDFDNIIDKEYDDELDDLEAFKTLTTLFPSPAVLATRKEKETTTTSNNNNNNKAIKSVIENRRATNISITLKLYKLNPYNLAKFSWALREMNEKFFTQPMLESFIKLKLWPTMEEKKLLKQFNSSSSSSSSSLPEADTYLLFLMNNIPDAEFRFQTLLFRFEFDEKIKQIERCISVYNTALKEILNSSLLPRVFRIILLIGNKINFEWNKENVPLKSIQLHGLLKLSSVKSKVDKQMSVLDFVILYLAKNCPELLEFPDELFMVQSVKKFETLETSIEELKTLKKGMEKIVGVFQNDSWKEFTSFSLKSIFYLERLVNVLNKNFELVFEFFGEDEQIKENVSHFFVLFNLFLDNFQTSVEGMDELSFNLNSKKLKNRGSVWGGVANKSNNGRKSVMARIFFNSNSSSKGKEEIAPLKINMEDVNNNVLPSPKYNNNNNNIKSSLDYVTPRAGPNVFIPKVNKG